jgi:hypothetical protein
MQRSVRRRNGAAEDTHTAPGRYRAAGALLWSMSL